MEFFSLAPIALLKMNLHLELLQIHSDLTLFSHALALAAGELVREPFGRAWPKPAPLKEIADTLPELLAAGQAVHLEWFADDSSDAHSWIERADRILEDDLHLAA